MTAETASAIRALEAGLLYCSADRRPMIEAQLAALVHNEAARQREIDTPAEAPAISPEASGAKPGPEQRQCPTCARLFRPRHHLHRYCTEGCKPEHRRLAEQPAQRQCLACARLFTPRANQRYCEGRCNPRKHRRIPDGTAEPKAPPVPYRTSRLGWDAGVVIRPSRPAPTRYYRMGDVGHDRKVVDHIGVALPFRDDLNAIADHGSPRLQMPQSMAGYVPGVTPLGALYSP